MFERLIGGSWRSSRGVAPSAVPARSGIRALEARFVFDAAAAATVAQSRVDAGGQAEHHGEQAAPADQAHAANAERMDIAPAAGPHETASTPGRHEVVVIDQSVPDLGTLLAGVPASAEVILIDSSRDGLDQLANALRGRTDIDAIHILSHGSEGDLRLGTSDLTADSIQGRYAADLAAIGAALSPDGDLLIYGCDFGGGAAGAYAVDLLARATGADIAASDDATGDVALGGDWDLEVHDGQIETGVVIGEETQRDWHHLLDATADNGRGAMLAVSGRTIYSVDITTGKASAITTAPASVGGINLSPTLNSLAVDQANGLIYYVDGANGSANKGLFAYDFINDQHILIDSDLTDNGVGASITTGTAGLGGAGAAFSNSHLYLAVENVSGTTDQIYNLTFSNNGRTVATAANFGDQSNHNYDWGDLAIDQANAQLISLTRASYARFDLNTGAEVSYDASVTRTDVQAGVDQGGYIYTLGTNITRLNPTDGSAIGSGRAITTDGTNAPATAISDAASWTPPTSTISGTVFADKDANGSLTSGEPGVRNITVDLVDDVNNNGVADSGERVLATASTDANGTYRFTGVLPGNFVIRVTDIEGRLSTASATTPTSGSVSDSRVGATLTGPNFGYNPTLVLDLDDAGAGTGHATSYTENAAPVAIAANDVAIADSLFTSLNSAKAVIENGSAGDVLGVNGTLPTGITASYDAATYTLTLRGSATIADYQTALSQITYTSTSEDPSATTRSVAVTVMDASIPSNTARSAITVTPVDDAPVLDLSSGSAGTGYAAAYTEGGVGVAIVGSDVTVTDTDNTTLASAHAVIGNGAAGDVLSVAGTLPVGISASYDPATYTLTLTGTASKADYQTALTQIRYASTSRDPDAGTRSIGFSVNDGSLDSNVATASIAVTAVDDAPDQGLPAGQSLAEDTSLVFSAIRGNAITVSDVDARGGNLTTTLGVAHGTLTLGSSAGVTVTGDGTGSLSLAGTASAIQAALDGLTYRPASDYNGTDTLSVSTNDNGNTGTGGPKTTTGSVALTVTPVDDAPVLDDRAGVFAPRAAIDQQEVAIPAGDAFRVASPGKSMAFSALGLPRNLIIDPGTGRISGMFARDASTATPGGLYSITVIARESDGASTSRVLSILVSNPPPVVSDTAAKLAQDTTYAGSLIGSARDPDGDVLHVDPLPVAAPAHGRLDLHPDGTFTYRPDAGFHGADAFSYAVVDADGGRTTATVRFTVDAAADSLANTPPVAGADPVHTRGQVPVEGRVTGHDADGDALSFGVATPPTSGGLVLRPDGGFTYTPAAGFRGSDSFIVRVSDNRGGAVFVTVPVSVEAVNHVPNVAAACLSVRAGATGCGTIRATDVDGDALTFRLMELPSHGTVAVELDGTFVYRPAARYVGSDHFTVRVSDGRGGSTDVEVPVAVTAPIKRVPDAALLCIGGVQRAIQSAPRSIDSSKIISCRASTPPHSDASTRLIIAGRPPQTAPATRGSGAAGNGRHIEASGAGINRNGLPLAAHPTHQSNLELAKSRTNGPTIDGRDAAISTRTSFFTRLSALAGRPNSGIGPIEKATKR